MGKEFIRQSMLTTHLPTAPSARGGVRREHLSWASQGEFHATGVSVHMRLCGSREESLKQGVGVEHPEDKGLTGLLTIPDDKEEE